MNQKPICAKCRHVVQGDWMGNRKIYWKCRAHVQKGFDYVSGKVIEKLPYCDHINSSGQCKKFLPKQK